MFFVANINKIKYFFTRVFFGFIIGASMMIPGLSGGTAAILLGVFYEIMNSVDCFLEKTINSIIHLFPYALGGLFGLVVTCYPLKYILNNYETYFIFFVIGIILGSMKTFWKNSKFSLKSFSFVLIGFIIVVFQNFIKRFYVSAEKSILFLFVIGILSAVALILPGISFTNILISFGYYDKFVDSINNFDLIFISVFVASLIFGVVLFSKMIMKIYNKSPDNTNLVLSGLMLGSILEIYPGFPEFNIIIECILLLVGGFCCSLALGGIEK